MPTRRYIVRGRVQGVGFRWFVEFEARQIGVTGRVRNLDSGEVETIASGTPEQLAELRKKLHQGPKAARVDRVDEFDADALAGRYQDFSIEGAW